MKTTMKTEMSTLGSTTETSYGSGMEPPKGKDVTNSGPSDLEQRIADLEQRPRMPSSGSGDDGDALVLDGTNPRWGVGGGLPDGVKLGDIAYWNPTGGSGGDGAWEILTRPEGAGKTINTTATTIEWDFLKWR